VHAVPTALVARAVTLDAAGPDWMIALFVASASGWAMLAGLRGIVVHQVADLPADRLANVNTFAGTFGVARSRQLVLRWLLPAEVACLATFLGLVLPAAPLAAVVMALWIGVECVKMRRGWMLPLFEPLGESRERYIPLVNNEIYEVWLPFGLALQLAITNPPVWLLLAVQTVAFFPNIRKRLADARRALLPGSAAFHVVIGATTWTVNGVNVFSANLARGLVETGVSAHVLLTEENTNLIQTSEMSMPRPAGVPFRSFPVSRTESWGAHWGGLVRYLEEAAPCVYIPNSDWRHSSVCPRLSDDVVVVGVVHSDDPLHYDHVRRLGRYWNAIVAVSSAVAQRTAELCPSEADRIVTIPIGVRIPAALPVRGDTAGSLRLIYHGTLKQHQKRVLDLPRIVEAASDLGIPVELSIAGAGPDEAALRRAAAPLVDRGLIR
ncbi:MAG: glycosyltransferase, partial [Vicinamibacterales bacterium]